MVLCAIMIIFKAHVEQDNEGWNTPAHDNILLSGQHTQRLDYAGHQTVHVDSLQQHKGEADGEKVVDTDGDDSTLNWYRFVGME